jgi:hypothetical protein
VTWRPKRGFWSMKRSSSGRDIAGLEPVAALAPKAGS